MTFTRRKLMALGASAAAAALLPIRAFAAVEEVGAIADFTGGAAVGEGGITIDMSVSRLEHPTVVVTEKFAHNKRVRASR